MKKGELGKSIVMNGVLAAFYFAAALFGLQFTVADNFATLIWPSTGIAFAAIFLFGYRVWPGIFIGAFAAFWITGAPPLMALTIALGNTLEAVLGAFVSYKAGFQATFKRMRDIIPFVIFGAIGATALSAFIGVKSLWLGNIGLTESFFETWRAWWFGNMLGALIFTPFILIWRRDHNIKLWRKQAWEAIGVVMFFLIIALFVFGFVYSSFADTAPVAYLLFLPIIWVAIRFGQREIATIIFLFAAVLPLGTLLGIGPFVYLAISESLLFLQVFMAVLSITGLVLATVMRERKETQQKYTEHIINEKEHVENILKSLSEGLIVINLKGEIEIINYRAQVLLGILGASVKGRRVEEIFVIKKGIGPHEKRQLLTQILKTGVTLIGSIADDFFIEPKKGVRFPAAVSVAPIKKDGITGAVIVFRDITKDKEIDRAKSEFVSLVSHQLRTPISSIRWYSEILADEDVGPLNKDQKTYMREVVRTIERMANLVNMFLNVSRIELDTVMIIPRPIHLSQTIDQIIGDVGEDLNKRRINLKREYDSRMELVTVDPRVLAVIIQNLLSNAIKYSPPEATITIQTKENSRNVQIAIKDTGHGIPKADQPKIFTKLFRAENAKQIDPTGSGLGLYIVKSLVERMGGTVSFESIEGKGTMFVVSLPKKGLKIFGKNPLSTGPLLPMDAREEGVEKK